MLHRPEASTSRSSSEQLRLRVCLAASGGGHLRQILDIESIFSTHDTFFVSENTILAQDLSKNRHMFYVEHMALGQVRQTSALRLMQAAWCNAIQSAVIVGREKPDVVITTGAGSVFFVVFWARILGAKIIVIETLSRFKRLSVFASWAGPLAHVKILQSRPLAKFWPRAPVFDPIRLLDEPRPAKQPLLFVTVGATLPFDRMVESVDELKRAGAIPERVIVQTGVGGLRPQGLESFETASFDEMLCILRDADVVVCHGGSGSLIPALRAGCRVVAMPRLPELGEHYDSHQLEITQAFAERGLLQVATSTEELAWALGMARARPPVMATSDPAALMSHLKSILAKWIARK